MEDIQWLAMAAVAIIAVNTTIHVCIQSLQTIILQGEWDAGYVSGRIEAKLENLEQLLRDMKRELARRECEHRVRKCR